ncbi:uncharacterized protein BDR25DRAFT_306111 [Lindgomyces ingoldianus]|uniref:Uncharacterized protein n=1 Tax=Lindgomyces ingoldianus TaxID=673940 RepID=A0ACB6QGW1_9PLEO|nr:uncharacterized protein BDR25DRAFT_306111 [Lindgomyces ingoldianus]KAF2466218.1 hypothetical protein BDR25DRAFT_306111 [Lindgomyces ingoldianus]
MDWVFFRVKPFLEFASSQQQTIQFFFFTIIVAIASHDKYSFFLWELGVYGSVHIPLRGGSRGSRIGILVSVHLAIHREI